MASKRPGTLYCSLLITIVFFNFVFLSKAPAQTLIRHSEVSEQEFKSYLTENKNFSSFKEYFITKHDYLDYAITKLFLEAEEATDLINQKILIEGLYGKLGQTFLSNQKRSVWVETLKLEKKNQNPVDKLNFNNQLFSILNKNSLLEHKKDRNYYQLAELNLEKDDDVYINGWAIYPSERDNIFLDKNLFYHFLFLSNSKSPFIKIGKPSSLNINRTMLVSGSCEITEFNTSVEEIRNKEIMALFNGNCLSKQSTLNKEKIDFNITNLNSNTNSFKTNWRKSPYTYGALFIGVALLANYNELSKYRIKITLPF